MEVGPSEGQKCFVPVDETMDWPAPRSQISAAQFFIKDCAARNHMVLIVPDKDGVHSSNTSILRINSDNIISGRSLFRKDYS